LQPQISVHDYKSLFVLETPFSTAVMFAQLVARLGNSSSMIILPFPLCLVFISVLLISGANYINSMQISCVHPVYEYDK